MPKTTLDEKRLQILRQQLSSQSIGSHSKKRVSTGQETIQKSDLSSSLSKISVSNASIDREDMSYVSQDLRKILVLSLLAVALQGALYFGLQMKLIHLWF